MSKGNVNFDYDKDMGWFYDAIKETLVQQDDYQGIGGHGLLKHGLHEKHSQTSIGLGGETINFRELK